MTADSSPKTDLQLVFSERDLSRFFHLAPTSLPNVFVGLSVVGTPHLDCFEIIENAFQKRWSRTLPVGDPSCSGESVNYFSVFSPPDKYSGCVGVVAPSGEVLFLDLKTGEPTPFLTGNPLHEPGQLGGPVCFTRNGQWCLECREVECEQEADTRIISLPTNRVSAELWTEATSFTEHPAGELFAMTQGSFDSSLSLFKVRDGLLDFLPVYIEWPHCVMFLAFSPDGQWLAATGGSPGSMSVIQLPSLTVKYHRLSVDGEQKLTSGVLLGMEQIPLCNQVAFSPDSQRLYVPAKDGGIDELLLGDETELVMNYGSSSYTTAMVTLPAAGYLLTSDSEANLHCWKLPETAPQRQEKKTIVRDELLHRLNSAEVEVELHLGPEGG